MNKRERNQKLEKMSPIDNRVLQVIERHPGSENDDNWLLFYYWTEVNRWDEGVDLYNNLRSSESAESILRARRRLHEHGFITYSTGAHARRERNFIRMRDVHSKFNLRRFFRKEK